MSNIQIFNVVVEIYFSYSKRTEEASNRILTQLKPTGLLTIRQALNKAEYSSMTAVVSVNSDKRLKLAAIGFFFCHQKSNFAHFPHDSIFW